MKKIMYIVSIAFGFLYTNVVYPDGERGVSYPFYPTTYDQFVAKGIEDALALKSIWLTNAQDHVFIIINRSTKTFKVVMKLPCTLGSTTIELTAPGKDSRNSTIIPVMERAFATKGCKPREIKLYTADNTKDPIDPPGIVKLDPGNEGSLVILIDEYLSSPGKYFIKVSTLNGDALTTKEKIIRDSRVPEDQDQVVSHYSMDIITKYTPSDGNKKK